MTNSEAFPTAAQALAQAIGYAQDGTNGIPAAERARLWLDIAIELRAEAQYRAIDTRRLRRENELAEQRLRNAGILPSPPPATPLPAEAASYGDLAQAADEATRYMPALGEPEFATQVIPIVWSPGDKADCAHCHTPIELHESEGDPESGNPDQREAYWQAWLHKYTGTAVCQTPVIAETETEEAVYTYAEPPMRG